MPEHIFPFAHALDPAQFARERLQFRPDPVQARVLDPSIRRGLLNCTRHCGKSTITSVRAVHNAYFNADSLTLVVAPTERQSADLVRKCRHWLTKLDISPRSDGANKTSLLLPNGARIVGLPGREDHIRGFSAASLLLIDEASQVPDHLYHAVRPMAAAAGGAASIWLISTPKGRRGFFYDEFANPKSAFTAISVPATECARIAPEFLEQERRSLPEHVFAQEYLCQFTSNAAGLYNETDIEAAVSPELPSLFPQNDPLLYLPQPINQLFPYPYQAFFIGVGIGQSHDRTAVVILELLTVFTNEHDPLTFERKTRRYHRVRFVDRIPFGAAPDAIAGYLERVVSRADLNGRTIVTIDASGAGAPIHEMFDQRCPPVKETTRVVIIGGKQATKDYARPHWSLPRRDLLYSIEHLLRRRQIDIASDTPHTRTLLRGLSLIERTFSDTNGEPLESALSTAHDDLVLALGLACWRARFHEVPCNVTPDAFRGLTNPRIPGLRPDYAQAMSMIT
ncbi:MAG: terminase family protein [Bryobacteraceae bacterium]